MRYSVCKSWDTPKKIAQGSAVAVNEFQLLTNCHVVKNSIVVLIVRGKKQYSAKIAAADPKTDRCILKTDKRLQDFVRSIRSFNGLRIGERVFSVGSPRGLENTFGEGLISGLRKSKNRRLIQTTAPISPGSSGGALFDAFGKLIGITTFRLKDSESLNFAIAVDEYSQ